MIVYNRAVNRKETAMDTVVKVRNEARVIAFDRVTVEDLPDIEYELTENELDGRKGYSLSVNMGESRVYLPDVTSNKERALELYRLFVCGRVTPVSAREVMEDLLA